MKIAVIGTGSTGVQAITATSRVAAETYVLQRTPHFVIPANNGPANAEKQQRLAGKFDDFRAELLRSGAGILALLQELNREGSTIVIITHDHEIAAQFGRRVELRDGVMM